MPDRLYPKVWPSTGQCLSEWHEGTKPKDWTGKPVQVCTAWTSCKCECHVVISKMFAEAGMDRVPLDNPEYVPVKRTWWMPSDDKQTTLEEKAAEGKIEIIESPAPDLVPATVKRDFAPTPTGRAGRGELEFWVKKTCDDWVVEGERVVCTPAYVSDEIARREGIKPPSVGAIGAVFDRWVAYGFAIIERKPVRFLGYTEDGKKYGLETMKARHKTKAKRQ